MDLNQSIAAFGVAVALLVFIVGTWKFFKLRGEARAKEGMENLVSSLECKIRSNTKDIERSLKEVEKLEEDREELARRLVYVESKLIDEGTVKTMIEDRVTPLEKSFLASHESVSNDIQDLRRSIISQDSNLKELLKSTAETSGIIKTLLSIASNQRT